MIMLRTTSPVRAAIAGACVLLGCGSTSDTAIGRDEQEMVAIASGGAGTGASGADGTGATAGGGAGTGATDSGSAGAGGGTDPLEGCACVVEPGIPLADEDDLDWELLEELAAADGGAGGGGGAPAKPPCEDDRKAVNECVHREMKKKYPKLGGIPPKTTSTVYQTLVDGACKTEYDKYKTCRANEPAGPATPGPSHYKPPYHIYYNSCHQAANNGNASGATGILLCNVGTYYQHHTVNYWQGTCTAQQAADAKLQVDGCQRVCVSCPQCGTTTADPDACCWTQKSGTSPNIGAGDGEKCSKQYCKDQQDGNQVCLPPGVDVVVDSPTDCKDESNGVVSPDVCKSCCTQEANKIVSANDQTDPWKKQRQQFLEDCNGACDTIPCPNNAHYNTKNGACLPSCGKAGGNTCAATQNGCRKKDGSLANRFYASHDCNYCCTL